MTGSRAKDEGKPVCRAAALAPIALSLALSSCLPLIEPAYGTSVSYDTACQGLICNSGALIRTTRQVREGDFVEGGRLWSSVSYRGWIISRIGADGVELAPSESSPERVFIPYGSADYVESRAPNPYNFESSLVFEKGFAPGTATMTIVEKPDYGTPIPRYMR